MGTLCQGPRARLARDRSDPPSHVGTADSARDDARGSQPRAARVRREHGRLHLVARRQSGLHRRSNRSGRSAVSRQHSPAVLRRARELRRNARVLVAYARAHRWHRVHEVRSRADVSQVLRRTDAALGSLGLGRRARFVERSQRPVPGGRGTRRARVRRGSHVLFDQRQLGQQRNHPAVGRDRWRRRARRPQLPQVAQLRAQSVRCDSGVPDAAAQCPRPDRPGAAIGNEPAQRRAEARRQRAREPTDRDHRSWRR